MLIKQTLQEVVKYFCHYDACYHYGREREFINTTFTLYRIASCSKVSHNFITCMIASLLDLKNKVKFKVCKITAVQTLDRSVLDPVKVCASRCLL